LHRQQGIAAQMKEVVPDADLFPAQQRF